MNLRNCTFILLLMALLATRLLDVHFHLPPRVSGEAPHLVALALVEAHHHGNTPDHGHIAQHLYEDEQDEGAGLLAKLSSGVVLFVPLLLGLLLLTWRTAASLPLPACCSAAPPRPRRWAYLAPPS